MLVIERTIYTIAEERAAKEQHQGSKSLPASTRFVQHSPLPAEHDKEEDKTWEFYKDVIRIADCQDMEAESYEDKKRGRNRGQANQLNRQLAHGLMCKGARQTKLCETLQHQRGLRRITRGSCRLTTRSCAGAGCFFPPER